MIVRGNIIDQPYAGQFEERIYDNASPWNSQGWTWVKFLNDDFTEWVGQFRGHPRGIATSEKFGNTIVLTSDYIFRLDNKTATIIELDDQPQYRSLTVAPDGSFIFADNHKIKRMIGELKTMEIIESPVEMDMIKFVKWANDTLLFTCEELANWDKHVEMELDSKEWKIKVRE